jgi:8-oxo-dGTP pyrophosphatase MutT (NUDIX family)
VIPRPADWRPGGAPPWGALPSERRASIGLARVLAALEAAGQAGPVPADVGKDGIFEAPVVGEMPAPLRDVNAGVLAAFFEEAGEARVILTRRSSGLRTHQGQVSFPGGRLDEGEDAVAAALREAFEEVDLDPSLVTTIGWLHPVLTMVSASFILPVLGTVERRPDLVANPGEVERIFDVSLAELADPAVFHEERWHIPGRVIAGSEDNSFPVWFFEVSGELIWGATARMLYELLSIVLAGSREL